MIYICINCTLYYRYKFKFDEEEQQIQEPIKTNEWEINFDDELEIDSGDPNGKIKRGIVEACKYVFASLYVILLFDFNIFILVILFITHIRQCKKNHKFQWDLESMFNRINTVCYQIIFKIHFLILLYIFFISFFCNFIYFLFSISRQE